MAAFGHVPEGGVLLRLVLGLDRVGLHRGEPEVGNLRLGLCPAFGQGGGQRHRAIGGARHDHAGGQGAARHEGLDIVAPFRLAALVAGQVHVGVPPARDGEAVDRQNLPVGQGDGFQALAAHGVHHARPADMPHVGQADRRSPVAAVDHGTDMHAARRQVGGGAPAVVVVGENGHFLARRHAEAVHVGPHGPRQHHAGAVVVAEGDGPLGAAGGEDGALGIDPPQDLARLAGAVCQVVGAAFERAIDAVIVGAVNGGAGHDAHVAHRRQFGQRLCRPVVTGHAAQFQCLGIEPAAGYEILVRQDHARPGPARRQCRRQARGPRADHQQVAMQEALVVLVGVFLHRQPPQPRRGADRRFVDLFPEGFRPHEGLVIEARRQEGREEIRHRHHVEFERAAMVLAAGGETVEELGHGGAGVGFGMGAGAQVDQRVGLFRAGGEDAARAVILEGPADQPLAVGEKRRGERVTGEPRERLVVEAKLERFRAVDQAAADAVGLRHLSRPLARATSRASSTRVISWVSVSRVTTSHERSPCS